MLNQENCEPCKGGIESLAQSECERLLTYTNNWELSTDSKFITKKFKFSNFKKSLNFVNEVGLTAEQEKHHPDIEFGWGYVNIKIQTHAINGLHKNDFILAAKIDEIKLP